MKVRSLYLKIVFAALALTASIWAQDGFEGALSRANLASKTNLGMPFGQTLAAADFDGDDEPDGAVLVDRGQLWPQSGFRTIELHFTGRENTNLTFESNETRLAILALDVNRDGATDIVVEQPFTHKRLHVWLNDGRGGFRKVRSEDFPSADADNYERLESPSQRSECPAFCLPSQRGSDIAFLTACTLPHRDSSAGEQALPFLPPLRFGAVAPNSPRAPPLSQSL